MKIEITKYPRECTACGKGFYEGFICCDDYFCSRKCLDTSFDDARNDDSTPMTWEQHYKQQGGDEGSPCYWSEWTLDDCDDEEDAQFQAVLSKNLIAEELADYKRTGELNADFILRQLRDIEGFTTEMNQPSVMDTYEGGK